VLVGNGTSSEEEAVHDPRGARRSPHVSVDNVGGSFGQSPTPANGTSSSIRENAPSVATFNMPADGPFFVWSSTLTPTTTDA